MKIALTLDKEIDALGMAALVNETTFTKSPEAIPQDDGIVISVEGFRGGIDNSYDFKLNIHLTQKDIYELVRRTSKQRGNSEQDEYEKDMRGELFF